MRHTSSYPRAAYHRKNCSFGIGIAFASTPNSLIRTVGDDDVDKEKKTFLFVMYTESDDNSRVHSSTIAVCDLGESNDPFVHLLRRLDDKLTQSERKQYAGRVVWFDIQSLQVIGIVGHDEIFPSGERAEFMDSAILDLAGRVAILGTLTIPTSNASVAAAAGLAVLAAPPNPNSLGATVAKANN